MCCGLVGLPVAALTADGAFLWRCMAPLVRSRFICVAPVLALGLLIVTLGSCYSIAIARGGWSKGDGHTRVGWSTSAGAPRRYVLPPVISQLGDLAPEHAVFAGGLSCVALMLLVSLLARQRQLLEAIDLIICDAETDVEDHRDDKASLLAISATFHSSSQQFSCRYSASDGRAWARRRSSAHDTWINGAHPLLSEESVQSQGNSR